MNLELPTLRKLDLVHPNAMKRSALLGDVRMEVEETVSEDGFGRALRSLESKGQIRIDVGEDVVRIAITSKGRNRVAEAR